MKYWLFQNNQVVGPHDREELAQQPGFSAESLVCPEGRKGTQMGDWARAGVVAELAETLLRAAKIPASVLSGDSGGFLPPEPTLRDLAVLGSLQEKVSLLESVLTQLQEDLRARDAETADLKVGLELKEQESASLKGKLEQVESRLAAAEALKDELARSQQSERETTDELKKEISKTQEDERAVAQAQSAQAQALEEIKQRLQTAQDDIKKQLDDVDRRQKEAVLAAQVPAPVPAPLPLGMPPLSKLPPLEKVSALDAAPKLGEVPPLGAAPVMEPPPLFGGPAAEAPSPMTAAPAPTPIPTPAPIKEAAESAEQVSDLIAAAPKKASKGKLVAVAVLILGALAAGAAYNLGLLDPLLGVKKAPAPEAVLPTDAPPAGEQTAQMGLPDRTQEAVELVKAVHAPGSPRSLAVRLEGPNPEPGLSPWTVDRLDAGRHQVNFYDRRTDSKTPLYRFVVLIESKEVRGLDPASQALLDADVLPPSAAPKPAKAKKAAGPAAKPAKAKKAAPKDELLQDPLGAMLMDSSLEDSKPARPARKSAALPDKEEFEETLLPPEDAHSPAPRRSAQAKPAARDPLEEALGDGADDSLPGGLKGEPAKSSPAPEAAKPAPKKGRKAAAPQKSKEELTLDELLLPGIPKQPE
ncbi:MAG: hypothetical protein WC969_03330 [Elusimicrobiota bacterium]